MRAGDLRTGGVLDAGRGPALIAHAAGNTPGSASARLAEGADFAEVDVWAYRGRLERRHERRVPFTPILFERWYARWAASPPPTLADLIAEVGPNGGIFLDLKNGSGSAALAGEAVAAAGPGLPVCASSQLWPVLRRLHRALPTMEMFYSIDVEAQLALFLSLADHDPTPSGVSCNHEHLEPALIRRFHDSGLAVVAWTVDDPERACELARAGVDAITTNRVLAIREALG